MPDETVDETLARARAAKTTDAARIQRVSQIASWLVAGHRTSEIMRLVEKAHARELKARRAHENERAESRRKPRKGRKRVDRQPFVVVWSDRATPPSERMIAEYIKRAKERIEADGDAIMRAKRAEIVGIQWARINDLYARAFRAKAFHVCARLIEHTTELFGVGEAIRLAIVGADGGTPTVNVVAESAMTEEQLDRELARVLQHGVDRAIAAGELPPGTTIATLMPAPIAATAASRLPAVGRAADPTSISGNDGDAGNGVHA